MTTRFLFQVANGPAANVWLGHRLHANRGHEPGFHTHRFQRILERQSVHDRGEHSHVVGGGLLDRFIAGRELSTAENVAATNDNGQLYFASMHAASTARR